jgi:predicted nucleic acid-binding protein
MRAICVDAGFFIALYDEGDEHHPIAKERFVKYFEGTSNQLLAPWPILYETVSTRMVRDRRRVEHFRRHWRLFERDRRLTLLDDQPLREAALAECLAEVEHDPRHYRSLSLADRVIRALLADRTLRINCFLTFNLPDFVDICRKRRIEVV